MRPLRTLDTGLKPARWNVALTAVLAELHEQGRIEDTLRFHRYPRSVLLGRHQDEDRDIDRRYCGTSGIAVARRVTGGGAVYMGPGVLAWDLVLPASAFGRDLSRCVASILAGLSVGLRELGVEASFRPPGDLVAEGKKLCGTAGWFEGGALLLQGSILIAFDWREMAKALRRPGEPIAFPAVTSLERLIGSTPDVSDVQAALAAGFETSLGRPLASARLSPEEIALAEAWLREREVEPILASAP